LSEYNKSNSASRLTLIIADDSNAITVHRRDGDDIRIKFRRELVSGHEYFLHEDGSLIPLDIPATIDVIKHLEETPAFDISDRDVDNITEKAKKLYRKKIQLTIRESQKSGQPPARVNVKTIARDALRIHLPNLPPVLLNQYTETIRKRLQRWIAKGLDN
jgi:hypothetical protein